MASDMLGFVGSMGCLSRVVWNTGFLCGFLMIPIMDSSNRVACCIIVTFSLCKTHRNVMFKVSICEEKGNIRLDEEMGGQKSMTHAGRPGN